jgi:hypothetical protein
MTVHHCDFCKIIFSKTLLHSRIFGLFLYPAFLINTGRQMLKVESLTIYQIYISTNEII